MNQEHITKELYRYYDLWVKYNDAYERWAQKHGMTSNYYMVLEVLYSQQEGCTQKMISQKCLIPKQTTNVILKDLEKKNYVTMTPMEKDKRNKLIRFTRKGEAYAGSIVSRMRTAEITVIKEMGVENMTVLNDQLESFIRLFEKEVNKNEI